MHVVITATVTMLDKYFIFMVLLSCPGMWAATQTCKKKLTIDTSTGKEKIKFGSLPQHKIKSNLSLSYDAKGLQPLFNLANSFMDTVQKKDMGVEFKDKKLEDIFKDGDEIKTVLKGYELPILICVGIGILFVLVMPIVGFCFCCCRCCNNCGGSMKQSEENSSQHCKVAVMILILFIFTVLMLCGVLFMFVTNNRLHDAVNSVVKKYDGAIDEANTMADVIIGDVKSLTTDQLPCIVGFLRTQMSDEYLKKDIGNPLKTQISGNVSAVLDLGLDSSNSIDKLYTELQNVVSITDTLINAGGKLQAEINVTKNNLTQIQEDCDKIASSSSPTCKDLKKIELNVEINFNQLPDLKSHLAEIKTVKDLDLKTNINEAKKMVNDIPDTVISKSKSTMDEVRKILTDVDKKIQDAGKKATDLMKEEVDKVKKDSKDFPVYKNLQDGSYDKYERIRWKVYVGLSALMAFIVLILFCGLFCGSCGYHKEYMPTERTTTSSCGGNFLMASVGLMFIFSFILMIFCVVWFILGIHVHLFCREMKNGEFIDRMVLAQINSKELEGLKFEDIIVNCRNNMPVFKASTILEKKFNVTQKLNVDVLKNVSKKIEKIDISLKDKKVLSADAKDALDKLLSSTGDQINYTKFFTELDRSVTGKDLSEIVTNLTKLSNATKAVSPQLATRIYNLGQEVKAIEDTMVTKIIKPQIVKLKAAVKKLQTDIPNIKNQGRDLLQKLQNSEYFIQNVNVLQYITSFTIQIVAFVEQSVDHIINQVTGELGRCKPVANIYDGLVNTYFCDNLVQNMNGFWLALGWCLLFFIPSIILSVKLAKYFRKMEYTTGMDTIVVDNPPYNDKMPVQELRAPPPYTSTQHSNPGYQHM